MKNKKEGNSYRHNSKRAQLSVFIILAIIIVAVVVILFINRSKISSIFVKAESPTEKIQSCVKQSTKDALGILEKQGGNMNPTNYYLYNDNKIDYLCYSDDYYRKCVMQKPMLKQEVQDEIQKYIQGKVEDCISYVKESYESSGYSVSNKKPTIDVEIMPKTIIVDTELDLKISNKDKTDSYKNIKTAVDTNIYDLVMTASSISNWEARYGDSETLAYMIYFPNLKVEKKTQSDGSRVYILTDRKTLENFMFAIKSMALPAGLTGN